MSDYGGNKEGGFTGLSGIAEPPLLVAMVPYQRNESGFNV